MMRNPGRSCEEAEALRVLIVQEAKKQKNGSAAGTFYRLERETAQKAFEGWTYSRILHWAADNHLMVVFLPGRALGFHVSGPETE